MDPLLLQPGGRPQQDEEVEQRKAEAGEDEQEQPNVAVVRAYAPPSNGTAHVKLPNEHSHGCQHNAGGCYEGVK